MKKIEEIISKAAENDTLDVKRFLFGSMDFTTLKCTDSEQSVMAFVERVNAWDNEHPDLPHPAAVCVYPCFAEIVNECLDVEGVEIACVSGGFPSSQTFAEVKTVETALALKDGATEIDMVLSVGKFLSGDMEGVTDEIKEMKSVCDGYGAKLKVILETGAMKTHEQIWDASIIAMAAGADFIKTSTGKNCDGASPEAAVVMTQAIKAFESKAGRKVGFKPAGGVRTPEDAALYYEIVRETLGDSHTVNTLFRIGASGLANNLLRQILAMKGQEAPEKYF